MKKQFTSIFALVMLIAQSNAFAEWKTDEWVDEFDDTKTLYASILSSHGMFFVWEGEDAYKGRLDVGDQYSPVSSVDKIRIDDNETFGLSTRGTPGIRTALFDFKFETVYQLHNGEKFIVRFCDILDQCYALKFSLKGSGSALCRALPTLSTSEGVCGNPAQ